MYIIFFIYDQIIFYEIATVYHFSANIHTLTVV